MKTPIVIGVDMGAPGGDRSCIVTRCTVCQRTNVFVEGVRSERWECSHVACPKRPRITAGPGEKAPRYHP